MPVSAFPAWRDRILGFDRIPGHQLTAHPLNWRTHPPTQQTAMAGVLEDVGQAAALLVYRSKVTGELTIIDGHLRHALNPTATWPCLLLDVSDEEAAYLLATLDPLAALAERDEPHLAQLLATVHTEQAAVQALLTALAADRAPATGHPDGGRPDAGAQVGDAHAISLLRLHYGVVPGQVWGCGWHRVCCGDATDPVAYGVVCEGGAVDAVVTDPPYGVGVAYEGFADTLENVERLIEGWLPLMRGYGVMALTPGIPAMWLYPRPAWLMAWVHPAPTSSGPWGFNGVNPILVYGKDPYLQQGLGRRIDHIVLSADREGETVHPTTKPLKVWAWLVERVTTGPGQTILDPFLGSGTSLIAAEQAGRRCLGIELDPGYVAVCLDRWERTTGEAPTLLTGG